MALDIQKFEGLDAFTAINLALTIEMEDYTLEEAFEYVGLEGESEEKIQLMLELGTLVDLEFHQVSIEDLQKQGVVEAVPVSVDTEPALLTSKVAGLFRIIKY